MPTINATVFPAQAYVLVEADWSGTILRDSFNRTVVDDWGETDTEQDWSAPSGAPSDFQVAAGHGIIIHTAASSTRGQIAAVTALDSDTSGVFVNAVTPVGAAIEAHIYVRYVDFSNHVVAQLFLNTTGTVTIRIRQVIGGVATNSSTVTAPGVLAAGVIRWRLRVQGAMSWLRVWQDGTPEPTAWQISLPLTWLTAGALRLGQFVGAVSNPLPLTFFWEDVVMVDPNEVGPQYAGVTRRNTVTGEIVRLRPYIAYDDEGNLLLDCGSGLWWDTEPPLNVPLEYCIVAADVATNRVQNGSFEGGTSGWTVAGGALTASTAFAHDGVQSGLLTPNGTDYSPNISQSLSGLDADVPFVVSAWVLSPQGWNAVLLRLVLGYSDGRSETFETPVEILDDGEWRQISITGTPDETVTSATLTFYATGTPPASTLFYVDDIIVSQEEPLATTACETVTVPSESVWLKSPLSPCSDVEIGICDPAFDECEEDSRVTYVGHDSDEYAPNTMVLAAVNRRRPIPVNRQRRDATSTLHVLAHDCDARDAVLLANEPGTPLLFQAPETYCIPDRYITVGTLTEQHIGVDQRNDFRLMSMPYAVVDRPEGPANGICGARIADLCDIYTSWAAMTMANLTWTDLLLGNASPDGPLQPDPPAGQRIWSQVESQFANWSAVEADGTWADIRDGT
jgi:hypothetical protein